MTVMINTQCDSNENATQGFAVIMDECRKKRMLSLRAYRVMAIKSKNGTDMTFISRQRAITFQKVRLYVIDCLTTTGSFNNSYRISIIPKEIGNDRARSSNVIELSHGESQCPVELERLAISHDTTDSTFYFPSIRSVESWRRENSDAFRKWLTGRCRLSITQSNHLFTPYVAPNWINIVDAHHLWTKCAKAKRRPCTPDPGPKH